MNVISLLIKPASSLCNLQCKYCFYSDVSNQREFENYGKMSFETLEILVKKAFNEATSMVCFAFQGGEPTLAGIEFYEKLIVFQKEYNTKNIKILNSIQTNGILIDEKWAEFFSANNFLVGISLDGDQVIHDSIRVNQNNQGTYKEVLKAIELFDKHNVQYNILCVVTNFIARYPKRIYNALKKYKYLQFIPCIDDFNLEKKVFSLTEKRYTNFLIEVFNEYYNDFFQHNYVSVRNFDNYISLLINGTAENCAMNGNCQCYYVIEGDGSVFPCDFYVLDKWKLGNINENSFEEMLKTAQADKFVNQSKFVNDACKSCEWYFICRGGCKRDREPVIDNKPSLNKFCNSYKAFFAKCYDKMKEMTNY